MNYQTYNFAGYISHFTEEPTDLETLIDLGIPKADNEKGIWIAGGAVRAALLCSPIETDVDYFFKNVEVFEEFCKDLKENSSLKIVEEYKNEHNVTYKVELYPQDSKPRYVKLQAITISYKPTLQEILEDFDFTITQFGYDGNDLVCGPFSLVDLFRKKLIVHKISFGAASLRRIIKYSKIGFYLCDGSARNFLLAIHENPTTLETEIRYID